jgi:hypothetical protein
LLAIIMGKKCSKNQDQTEQVINQKSSADQ